MLKSRAGTSSLRAAIVPQSRDCTKTAMEGILSANAARVFVKTDAFAAAIAQNRPWRAFCLQTWQGFSPKRTLSLPRLHKIGPGGWSVCKRGKGRKGYPPPACLRRRQHQQHSHRKQQRHRPHSHRHRHQQHSLHDGLTAQGCCHGSKRWDDDRKKRLKRRHGSKEWDDGSTQELRRPPYFAARIALCQSAIYHQGIRLSSHQGIRLSNHQSIRASGHQGIRLSNHQGIRLSSHQGIKPIKETGTFPGHIGRSKGLVMHFSFPVAPGAIGKLRQKSGPG